MFINYYDNVIQQFLLSTLHNIMQGYISILAFPCFVKGFKYGSKKGTREKARRYRVWR